MGVRAGTRVSKGLVAGTGSRTEQLFNIEAGQHHEAGKAAGASKNRSTNTKHKPYNHHKEQCRATVVRVHHQGQAHDVIELMRPAQVSQPGTTSIEAHDTDRQKAKKQARRIRRTGLL